MLRGVAVKRDPFFVYGGAFMAGVPTNFKYSLKELETTEIVALGTYDPGVYYLDFHTQGNSLLSTLYVSQANGGSVLIEYFDYSTGRAEGQLYPLQFHDLVSTDITTNKLTVTRLNNKPVAKITVSGAAVRFSLTVTVVSSFASDLDAALIKDGESFEQPLDQGLPVAAVDESTNVLRFLRTNSLGELLIAGNLTTVNQVLANRLYNESLSLAHNATATHINYTVPAGKTFRWLDGWGSGSAHGLWRVEIDGATFLTQRNAYDSPNVRLRLEPGVILSAGQLLTVSVTNNSVEHLANHFETSILGRLE